MPSLRRASCHRGPGACVLALAGSLLVAGVLAAEPRWEQVGMPFGGAVNALAQARSAPDVLYAGTDAAGVFRSRDGGASWTARNHGFPAAAKVVDLAVDPYDSRTVFAAAWDVASPETLMRSRDGGASWTAVGQEWSLVLALAFDPRSRGVLYVATVSGLYRTSDWGDTWEVMLAGQRVASVAIDPRDSTALYATASSDADSDANSVWRSADRGQTWTSQTVVSLTGDVYGLTFDPARPGTLYALVHYPIVLRTRDAGASWETLPLNPEDLWLASIAPSPTGVLNAATSRGVMRSFDGGATWSSPGETKPFDQLARVIVAPRTPHVLYAAGRQGVWVSWSGGAGWHPASEGITAQTVRSLAAARGDPAGVLAVLDSGVFRSSDRGHAWNRTHAGNVRYPDGDLVAAASAPRRLYAVERSNRNGSLLRSDDGGRSWQDLGAPIPVGGYWEIGALAVAPSAPDSVYEGVNGLNSQTPTFLWATEDGGKTWAYLDVPAGPVGFGGVISALAVDPRASRTLYVGGSHLAKSEDAGRTWRQIGPQDVPVTALAIDPSHPDKVYAGTSRGEVFASGDGGATFASMSCGLEGAGGGVSALLVDPEDSTRLYLAVKEHAEPVGVWRWDAAARCWQQIVQGLPLDLFSGSIALDARRPAALYAGTQGRGIYRLQLDRD